MAQQKTIGGTVHSVERALQLIECLSTDPSGRRILQLSEETGLPPSTVHRALQTLINCGYAAQESANGRYRLTTKLLDIASRAVAGRKLREEAGPILAALRDTTDESAHLAVLDGDHVVTVESFLSHQRNLVDCRVGEHLPLHCNSVGKCLMADMTEDEVKALYPRTDLTLYTPRTIGTRAELLKELERVRAQGYALDWDEYEAGIRCVAACVRDVSGAVVAAIGISGPSQRITKDKVGPLANAVQTAAADLSRTLGYAG